MTAAFERKKNSIKIVILPNFRRDYILYTVFPAVFIIILEPWLLQKYSYFLFSDVYNIRHMFAVVIFQASLDLIRRWKTSRAKNLF